MSSWRILAAAGALAVLAGVVVGSRERAPVPIVEPAPTTTESEALDVHVAGWVRSPGVVRLPDGAIVAAAIEAADGFKPGAASHEINLAAKLRDGDQIYVPGPSAGGGEDPENGLVPLNRATASELETLPGVGPVLAMRIVSYRAEHGPFEVVEDLLEVPGIGESKLAALRDLIRVP